jgi:hypothetical protein
VVANGADEEAPQDHHWFPRDFKTQIACKCPELKPFSIDDYTTKIGDGRKGHEHDLVHRLSFWDLSDPMNWHRLDAPVPNRQQDLDYNNQFKILLNNSKDCCDLIRGTVILSQVYYYLINYVRWQKKKQPSIFHTRKWGTNTITTDDFFALIPRACPPERWGGFEIIAEAGTLGGRRRLKHLIHQGLEVEIIISDFYRGTWWEEYEREVLGQKSIGALRPEHRARQLHPLLMMLQENYRQIGLQTPNYQLQLIDADGKCRTTGGRGTVSLAPRNWEVPCDNLRFNTQRQPQRIGR